LFWIFFLPSFSSSVLSIENHLMCKSANSSLFYFWWGVNIFTLTTF
jgi:hypothetical protein